MIRPLYNNIVLKKEKASNTTASGIIISQKEKEEEFAVVVAVSDLDEVKINDKYYKMPLKVGDKVMYKKLEKLKLQLLKQPKHLLLLKQLNQ